jgi:hypothetical protein
VEVAVALDDLPDAERRLARLGGVVSVDEVSYQTWVWSAAALPLLRNDVAGALGGLERVARDPRIGSRAYLAREYEAIVRGLSGEIGPARRAAEEAARLSALYHGRAAEPDGLAPYVAGLAAHRRADRATLARASAELAEAQGTLAAARAALVAALLDASEDRPTEAALGLAGIESLHGGVNFLAALERARLLVEVGRNAEADVAYDAAVDRRAESQLAPEVAFDWRACLVEASARAHARGDEAKAAALAARLAALDQR